MGIGGQRQGALNVCVAVEPGPHGSAEAATSQTPLRGADLCGCGGGVAVVQRRRRRRLLPEEGPSRPFAALVLVARPARAATCLRPVCIAQLLLFCLPPTSASQLHAGHERVRSRHEKQSPERRHRVPIEF
jgi:hypothetical protein